MQTVDQLNQRRIRAAWRGAAETWLRTQGLIQITINQKVSLLAGSSCGVNS